MEASYQGGGDRRWLWLCGLACLAGLAGGICGCAHSWDEITSTDFKFKQLFSRPDALVVLRDSTDGDQRARALRSLREPLQNGGNQKDQEAFVQILTAAATTDKEPLCRIAAITALAHFKDPRAPQVLIVADQKAELDFSRAKSTLIRQQALGALGECRSPEACDWLMKVARAGAKEERETEKLQTFDVRLAAIRALGKYKQPEATELLVHLVKTERDVAVRDCAQESLQLATGKPLPAEAPAREGALQPSAQQTAKVN